MLSVRYCFLTAFDSAILKPTQKRFPTQSPIYMHVYRTAIWYFNLPFGPATVTDLKAVGLQLMSREPAGKVHKV